MAEKTYMGIEAKARKISKIYIGEDGVARKVKAVYLGVDNVAKKVFGGPHIPTMVITYTGKFTDEIVTMADGKQYRLLTLTSSGTLIFEKQVIGDVWLCGGGKKGTAAGSGVYDTGDGGSGSNFIQEDDINLLSNAVVVASANGTSKFDTISSANGYKGGGGAIGCNTAVPGRGGAKAETCTLPFKDGYFKKFPCAGGGSGGYIWSTLKAEGAEGGSSQKKGDDGASTAATGKGGKGGVTGGGAGGDPTVSDENGFYKINGEKATYYGSGGGGGGLNHLSAINELKGTAGAGYQGVCFVRIPLQQ